MATVTNYMIVRDLAGGGYRAEVTSPGHYRSVSGFRAERAAQDWIEQQRAAEAGADRTSQT